MASYSTIPKTDEAPLLQRDVKVNVKTILAGAAVASFALGALAATAVSSSVAAPTTSFFRPMYVFNKKLGLKTFAECQDECPTISGNAFKRGEMHIPCITSFDMNHQLLAWMTEKYGSVESFVWIGHKTNNNGDDGAWVGDDSSVDYQKKESKCQEFQDDQYKGDFINRNGCAFNGNLQKPKCEGSEFDKAKGCAVLVYAKAGPTGASALNVPNGEVTSYEMLHGNWVKSADCEVLDVPAFGPRKTVECICQKIV